MYLYLQSNCRGNAAFDENRKRTATELSSAVLEGRHREEEVGEDEKETEDAIIQTSKKIG